MASLRFRAALLFCAVVQMGCRDKPTTGAIVVTIDGLPSGAPASVSVSGPNDFFQRLTATTTLENLAPGSYVLNIAAVRYANAMYTSTTTQEFHTVTAGGTEAATVPYALGSGSINIAVSGLPLDLRPTLFLTCAACGLSRVINASGAVNELPPGNYVLRADTLTSLDGDRFGAAIYQQSITVAASLTPVDANVSYALSSGTLEVTVNGLGVEGQSPAPVSVTGPGGFRRSLAVSTKLRGMEPGTYTISATTAGACPNVYRPDIPSQTAAVTVGATTPASVSFTQSQFLASNLNLRVDAAHLIQVVQDYAGATPMVAGKPALLRVFAIANQCNSAAPKVRVTLGGIPNARTIDLSPTESSVRTSPDQGVLVSSYNQMLSGAEVQPGLTIIAEIDPTNTVSEATETDNRLPATGVRAIDVRSVPQVGVRFVSVVVADNAGNVSDTRVDSLLAVSRRIHPISAYNADVRATPYTSSRAAFTSSGGSWAEVLSELNALRLADSTTTPTSRYYQGIVRVTYNSGVAGMAYIGGKAALSWDFLPTASDVVAHELGHNFGRFHAPCGVTSGVDQNYPTTGDYSGGYIGQYGIDLSTMSLKSPKFFTDVMGYCSRKWISDYTYFFMMRWLIDHPAQASVTSAAVQPSMLVWGRIVNGQPVLEPAFEIDARPELPRAAGPHRITAFDASGGEIVSLSFAGNRIADLPGDQQSFAFAIPMSMLRGRSLASLELTANGKTVTSVASGDVATDAQTVATRVGGRAMHLTWNASRFPAVMVRDPARGEILSFARGGDATIVTGDAPVELVYSNRIHSVRVRPQLR